MNTRIDELNKKLDSNFYRKLNAAELIEEKEKYANTETLSKMTSLSVPETLNEIIKEQEFKLEKQKVFDEQLTDMSNTISEMNVDIDEIINKFDDSSNINFNKKNFEMTSSSLNVDKVLLREMDKKINEINGTETFPELAFFTPDLNQTIDSREDQLIDGANNSVTIEKIIQDPDQTVDEKIPTKEIIVSNLTYNFTMSDLKPDKAVIKDSHVMRNFIISLVILIVIGTIIASLLYFGNTTS